MKKYSLIFISILFGSQLLKAQLPSGSYSDYFKEGTFLLMEENYDMEKCEVDSPYITLLLHFNNLMYLGDWEYPYLGYLTTDL